MKRAIIYLMILTGFISCEKNKLTDKEEQFIDLASYAAVKIGHFIPFSSATNKGVIYKINDVPFSNTITYAVAYPGGGYNMGGQTFGDYLLVDSKSNKISISIPQVNTNIDSIPIFNGTISLQGGKRQTLMITDTGSNIQITPLIDEITVPSAGKATGKFFNGIPNVGANVDLYIRTPIGQILAAQNIAYKAVSQNFEFPGSVGNDTFDIVKTGLPNITANRLSASYVFTAPEAGRNYTVLSRGFILTPTSTTDIRRPLISLIVTR